jgi:hypothetical protein
VAWADDITVINTNATGAGSLEQAIIDANATPGPHTIFFDIPESEAGPDGEYHIDAAPEAQLDITEEIMIDGWSQTGGDSSRPVIEVTGPPDGLTDGFDIKADNTTIRGLIVNGFSAQQMRIAANNVVLRGNWIGLDASGTASGGGGSANGVHVTGATSGTIGGAAPADWSTPWWWPPRSPVMPLTGRA